jgi:hypothetical protein
MNLIKTNKIYFLNFYCSDENMTLRGNKIVMQESGIVFNDAPEYIKNNINVNAINNLKAFNFISCIPSEIDDSIKYLKKNINFENFENINLQDKILYRTPKLNLPTAKVDLLKEKYKTTVKRDINKADYIITSEEYIKSLLFTSWSFSTYNAHDLWSHLQNIKDKFDEFAWHKIVDFFNNIDHEDYIHVRYMGTYDLRSKFDIFNSSIHYDKIYPSCITNLEHFNYLEDPKIKKVLDTDIISLCNEDSVVLTINDMKSIITMLKSQDKVNHDMALELLANCNIQKSYDKIALVFAFYSGIIKYANNWNHVNVKSLRKSMEDVPSIEYNNHVSPYNALIKVLHEKGRLTRFAVRAIQQKFYNSVLERIGLTYDVCVFDIKATDLKLKDSFNIIDDFSS